MRAWITAFGDVGAEADRRLARPACALPPARHERVVGERRNSTITHNRISYGAIGLAWFQYDTTAGTSRWTDNSISHVRAAGIFVCGTGEGWQAPLESFQISGDSIADYGATEMNLQPTSGSYSVAQSQGDAGAPAASRPATDGSRAAGSRHSAPGRARHSPAGRPLRLSRLSLDVRRCAEALDASRAQRRRDRREGARRARLWG
jgi:hypothetical protein